MMMYKWLAGIGAVVIVAAVGMTACDVQAGELVNNEDRSRGWQDRSYFGRAYTEQQIGGGDGSAGGESGGDAGATGGGSGGDSGGEGDGCGPK